MADRESDADAGLLGADAVAALCRVRELETQRCPHEWDVTLHGVPGRPELDGCRGTTSGYDDLLESYEVTVAGRDEPVAVPADNVVFAFSARPSDAAAATREELLQTVRELFVPGSRFEGTIAIPGMSQHNGEAEGERKPYTLAILSKSLSETSEIMLSAVHAAYGDEQACHVDFVVTSAKGAEQVEVSLVYADGETCCEGLVELGEQDGQCRVRGRVKQLVQGEEGFFEPAIEVAHTFVLFRGRCADFNAQHCLETAKVRRVRELCTQLRQMDLPFGHSMPLRLRAIPWRDVVDDAQRLCEVQCAELRRQSTLLDGLKFHTDTDKEQLLGTLSKAGIDRAACHAANDEIMMQLKTLLMASAQELEPGHLQQVCLKAHHRLVESYARFDRSIRSAQARLPQSTIWAWNQARPADAEAPCAVCFVPLGGREWDCSRLPCGHWYHSECVATWFHSHTTCPTCRRDLTSAEEQLGAPDGRAAAQEQRVASLERQLATELEEQRRQHMRIAELETLYAARLTAEQPDVGVITGAPIAPAPPESGGSPDPG